MISLTASIADAESIIAPEHVLLGIEVLRRQRQRADAAKPGSAVDRAWEDRTITGLVKPVAGPAATVWKGG